MYALSTLGSSAGEDPGVTSQIDQALRPHAERDGDRGGDRQPPDQRRRRTERHRAWRRVLEPHRDDDAEIEERCVLSLVNIGAQILDEGLAYRAADIDVVWTSGYGFPRWRGGPMFYADTLGIDFTVSRIEKYWQPAASLRGLTSDGRSFADWDRTRES